MKKQCFVFVGLLLTSLASNGQVITNTVLTAGDVPGMEIFSISVSPWGYLAEDGLEIMLNPGINQSIQTNGFRLYLSYSEFPSEELAQKSAEHRIKHVVAVYSKGMWGWFNKRKIGDVSWHHAYGGSAGLTIISGKTSYVVSCQGYNLATCKKLCEELAIKIENKIKNGSHVIVSNENPPPVIAPAPSP